MVCLPFQEGPTMVNCLPLQSNAVKCVCVAQAETRST